MNSTTNNKIPAAFIPAASSQRITVIDITDSITSMYGPIGCDIVEPVALNEHYKACLWVDEEALCKADHVLNVRASCLAGRPIYGNAIMAGQDNDYNIVPLSIACPKIFFDFLEEEATRFLYEIVKNAMSEGQI